MSDCNHTWETRPKASGRGTTRYQCTTCGCWGYRHWTKNKDFQKIIAYVIHGKLRMEPEASWFTVPNWGNASPPKTRDVGLVESLAPSNDKWHDPR